MTNEKIIDNEKVLHLERLVSKCISIQKELLKRGRCSHYDYVIVNLFDSVQRYPGLTEIQLEKVYNTLLNTHYWSDRKALRLFSKNQPPTLFTSKSLIR